VTKAERGTVASAIAEAEGGTTGRIAVRVIPDRDVEAFARAKLEFEWAGLQRHPGANAALILVATHARRFAVIGDRALHERVGDAFWNDVVKESQPFFARGETVSGILYAVARIGEALHAHFPEPPEAARA
jgi:uncharacterized membrane protein